jgi:hypothetical protein
VLDKDKKVLGKYSGFEQVKSAAAAAAAPPQ